MVALRDGGVGGSLQRRYLCSPPQPAVGPLVFAFVTTDAQIYYLTRMFYSATPACDNVVILIVFTIATNEFVDTFAFFFS